MKLIVSGATGFVASEVVRQSLAHPSITQVIALSRREVQLNGNCSAEQRGKFKQVLLKEYGEYPAEVLEQLKGADACIWTVSITPTKSRMHDFEVVKQVCQTSTTSALKALLSVGVATPFRFLYMSGEGIDPDKPDLDAPLGFGPYIRMRAETEKQLRDIAAAHPGGGVEVGVARPAMITSSEGLWRTVWGTLVRGAGSLVPHVGRDEVAAAMIEQAVKGFEKPALSNAELKVKGGEILRRRAQEAKGGK